MTDCPCCLQNTVESIDYARAHQVPDMERGFAIHTNYGVIEVTQADGLAVLAAFAAQVGVLLQKRRDRLAPPPEKPQRAKRGKGASS